MTLDLQILAWTLLLALVQIMLPAFARNQEYGVARNLGPRDEEAPPPSKLTGRLDRAQKNLFETLPIFIALVLAAHVANADAGLTCIGAATYLGARIVYVPVYVLGVPGLRSLIWTIGVVGLGVIFYTLFTL